MKPSTAAHSPLIDIVDTFKSGLPDLEWMDKESAKGAAEKARMNL